MENSAKLQYHRLRLCLAANPPYRVAVTEVGTLELQAVSQQDGTRWKIQFDVRARDEA